ncbi:hypothetical protein CDEN61S_01021 [Castellaniella denitrificans]|uniref:glycosyltransferase family 4 protein n=1 Tax=Castellaniella sp. TaxID=1955812 RepID=UPI003D0FA34D
MRILLVSQYFWPENFGINALAIALRKRGVAVSVLTGKPNYPDGVVFGNYSAWGCGSEDWNGIKISRIPIFPRGKRSALRLALNYISFIVAGLIFGSWKLRGQQFDAIFVYAPSPILQALPALWLARQKRAPLALWVQDLWPQSLEATGFVKNRGLLDSVARVVRFIYRHTDRILVPSEGFRSPIAALVDNPEKIHFYPNAWIEPSDLETFESAVDALCEEISEGFSVVFAGNLGTAQALDVILDAAAIVKNTDVNIRIFLIGSGSLSDWLAAEITRRELFNVVLPGRFPPEAMTRLYAAASALLVTLRDEPIFALTIPSKVQSYLAAGRPVIASLNGEGARVITEAGAGLVCPAGNAVALAAALFEMRSMEAERREKMAENARKYAIENFSLDSLTNELLAHLEDLEVNHGRKSL